MSYDYVVTEFENRSSYRVAADRTPLHAIAAPAAAPVITEEIVALSHRQALARSRSELFECNGLPVLVAANLFKCNSLPALVRYPICDNSNKCINLLFDESCSISGGTHG